MGKVKVDSFTELMQMLIFARWKVGGLRADLLANNGGLDYFCYCSIESLSTRRANMISNI